jgi:hypothetical protein
MEDLFNLDAQIHAAAPEARAALHARREQLTREVTRLKKYLYASKDQPDDVALHKRSLEILKQMQSDGVDIDPSEQAHISMLEKRVERTP